MTQHRNFRPNMFAVVPKAVNRDDVMVALKRELFGKGYFLVATVAADQSITPLTADEVPPYASAAWIFTSYELHESDDILAARHANLLLKFARILRRNDVQAHILSEAAWSAQTGWRLGERFRAEPDRDLNLGPDERFVADLTSNAVRSTIWLIERDGELLIRKAFSHHFPGFVDNELAARQVLRDPRIVEVSERRGDVLYMPFIRGSKAWDGQLFSFCSRDHARAVRSFLADINRAGYSMVDVNPSAFLFNQSGELKVVDFEFFIRTRPAADFRSSCDYSGEFDKPGLPKKNGWVRYWYDAVGGHWEKIEHMSNLGYRAHLAVHLLGYRLPMRVGRALEQGSKHALNQIRRVAGLKLVGVDAGQFHA